MRPDSIHHHLANQPVSLAKAPRHDTATLQADPQADLLAQVRAISGLGPKLAARVCEQLGVRTLEQLELAAHTGRLQTVAGIGPGRARRVREQLDARFKQTRRTR